MATMGSSKRAVDVRLNKLNAIYRD